MTQRNPEVSRLTIARCLNVREDSPAANQLISRCVRRVYSCGDDTEHRLGWRVHFIQRPAALLYVNAAVVQYRQANPDQFRYPIGSVFTKEIPCDPGQMYILGR